MKDLVKTEGKQILIVDKVGILGERLCQKLSQDLVVVYVSQKKPGLENTIFVPYGSNIPIIPDNNYSHILVIDDGIVTAGFLSEFIKKAEKDRSLFIFTISLSKANEKIIKSVTSYKRAKVAVIGDIFAKDIYPPFIYRAIKFGKIQLLDDGLSKTYPVFLEDVISGIIKLALEPDTFSSIFYIFPKHPPTQLSLARMIQKANPTVQIDFIKGSPKKEQGIFLPANGRYLLVDNYPLEKKIRQLDIEGLSQARLPQAATLASLRSGQGAGKKTNLKKGTKKLALIALLISFIFFLTLPIIATLLFSLLGFAMLESTRTAIENGNLVDAQKSTKSSRAFFYLAKMTSRPLLAEARFIGKEESLGPIIKKINLGYDLSQVAAYGLDAARILSKVSMGKSKNAKEDFIKGASLLKNAIVIFRQKEAEGIPADLLIKTKSVDNLIRIVENTIDVLPSIFGLDGEKTYLVLFQNNMELRPGGGFIGSYGLLTFDAVRVTDFSIHDVYDADGQLREHVEPPYAIRRHLHLPNWYLRDSNFDVDFARAASSSALLLSKELGKRVDGVIGIDVSFAKSILEAIGPVYVLDYKKTVTSSNFFKLAASHAEKEFFPGSRQKKDFLRSLFNSMQLNTALRENLPYLSLAKTISESMLKKHLLFAFNDKYIQDIFTVNGWSSTLWEVPSGTSLWDNRKEKSGSINDFLGINEANLGVNKANYFVKREIFHSVNIDNEGKIIGEIKIEYENSSNSWPGGDYINYLRVVLPLDTTLLSISFDGVSQEIIPAVTDPKVYEAKNFVKPLGLEVEEYDQEGKTIYGFIVNIEASKSKAIELKYAHPQKISLDSPNFSYNLRVFKQPGTDSYPYSFLFTYPKNLRIVSGLSSFSQMFSTDTELNLNFAQR